MMTASPTGVCVWLTGLSGAGKSTISQALAGLIRARGREVTLLDGDVVRTLLSRGLGFSREDRDMNIGRIAFVAGEIVRHKGIVICAAVSPYRAARETARATVGPDRFVEVFVDTPLNVCQERDPKGLYLRARRGELKGFTGIDDPYEAPLDPEMVLTTVAVDPQQNAAAIVAYLVNRGLLDDEGRGSVQRG